MNFKISTKKEDIAETSGNYMNKSGIYDCVINFASIAVSKGGAESINFNVEYNGTPATIYGPYVTDKAGNDLEIGRKLIHKLGVIAGLSDGDELEVEEEEHTVGKDNKTQTFAVIQQFSGLPVKIRLQEEYSKYEGEIKKSMVIKSFFREDGASADEIINKTEIGKRLEQETTKYANNITYKDGLIPEDIENWAANKSSAKKVTPTSTAPKKPLFARK